MSSQVSSQALNWHNCLKIFTFLKKVSVETVRVVNFTALWFSMDPIKDLQAQKRDEFHEILFKFAAWSRSVAVKLVAITIQLDKT